MIVLNITMSDEDEIQESLHHVSSAVRSVLPSIRRFKHVSQLGKEFR